MKEGVHHVRLLLPEIHERRREEETRRAFDQTRGCEESEEVIATARVDVSSHVCARVCVCVCVCVRHHYIKWTSIILIKNFMKSLK